MKTILLALLLVAGPASLARLKRQSYGGLMGGGGGYGGGGYGGGAQQYSGAGAGGYGRSNVEVTRSVFSILISASSCVGHVTLWRREDG